MGYSYFGSGPEKGKLCCDACPDGVGRKRKCPYGYCPAPAICKACWESGERERSARYHEEADCKKSHEDYQAKQRKDELMTAGLFVRKARWGSSTGRGW